MEIGVAGAIRRARGRHARDQGRPAPIRDAAAERHGVCADERHFFAHDLRLLDGLPVDLGFIDGMHLFEFALRDFINLERHSAAGSTILFDDCWPLEQRAAARERTTQFWSGDVWRILPALRRYRPELRIRTIATAPAGLCVVRGLDPASRVLTDNYEAIVQEFGALDFSAFEAQREALLGPCANDWESIRQVLA
jgi:hypothetical protein